MRLKSFMEKNNKKTTSKKAQQNSYAIVEASGKQFWVEPNRYYDLDRIDSKIDDVLTIDKVLLVHDGKDSTIGKPYVKGASIKIKVMEHRRGPKIIVYKMRPKKKTRRKNGHRQELTRVMVTSISPSRKVTKKEKDSPDAAKTSRIKKEKE